jgi:hypothetical protein
VVVGREARNSTRRPPDPEGSGGRRLVGPGYFAEAEYCSGRAPARNIRWAWRARRCEVRR